MELKRNAESVVIEDKDLGVQVLLPPSAVAHLDDEGLAVLTEHLKDYAEKIVLTAQQVTVDKAQKPFQKSTAEDVQRAVERYESRLMSRLRLERRAAKIAQDFSLVGIGGGLSFVVSSPGWAAVAILGCCVLYQWANSLESRPPAKR